MVSTATKETYKVRTVQIPLLADEKTQQRFWKHVSKTEGCWQWLGWTTRGHGRFKIGLQRYAAHRLAYTWAKGKIPNGLTLDHKCRNRGCVKPDHLEPVTVVENVLRGESVPAKNARKTTCVRGHALKGHNASYREYAGRTERRCRICYNRFLCERRARRKAEGRPLIGGRPRIGDIKGPDGRWRKPKVLA